MNAKLLLTTLAAAALMAPAAFRAAGAPAAGPASAAPDAGRASAARAVSPASLAGTWRLDLSKSTLPQRPADGSGVRGGRPGGGVRPGGRAGPGGGSGAGGPREGRRAGGPGEIPRLLRVTERDGLVTLADSAGTALHEIVTADPAPPPTGVRRAGGEWDQGTLVTLRDLPMGGLVVERYAVRDGGATLEIRTRIEPEGDRPAREFTRVYRRVESK